MQPATESADVKAAIYLRISRDVSDQRKGVERQLIDCRELATELGWPIVAVFDENNTSATRSKRPEYQRLIAAIEAGRVNAILFWEFDRFTRSVREADDLLTLAGAKGLRAASTSGGEMDLISPTGRHNVITSGSSARRETEQLSKRLRRAFAQSAAKGQPHGFAAFGYRRVIEHNYKGSRVGSRDELVPIEAEIIRNAARSLLAGVSLRSVVAEVNASGVTTPRGHPWTSTTLRQVMLRERNAGLRRHQGQVIGPAAWPAIYDEGTHTQIVALLTDPSRRTNKGATRKHLLTGIARCGREGCLGTMVVNVGRVAPDGKHQPPAYVCATCTRIRRKQAAVDEIVEAVMIGRLSQPDALTALAEGDPVAVDGARAERDALRARLELAADEYADGGITGGQLRRISERLRPLIEAAERQITAEAGIGMLTDMIGLDAGKRWASAPLDVRRSLIELLCEVTILPTGSGRAFNPADIQIRWLS